MERCLEVDSVLQSFGDRMILADVYLCCRPGDIIGLFGRNGCGKSTLLKIIFGTQKGDRRFIQIDGKIIKRKAFESGQITYLPQENYLPAHLKIDEVLDACIPKEEKKNFLADKFLFKVRNCRIKELSGGELRYLEIKLALYSLTPYILLDEPFNGLSPIAAESIREHIRINSQHKGIILTDHNFREIHKVANRILLLDRGYLKEIKNRSDLISFGYYEE